MTQITPQIEIRIDQKIQNRIRSIFKDLIKVFDMREKKGMDIDEIFKFFTEITTLKFNEDKGVFDLTLSRWYLMIKWQIMMMYVRSFCGRGTKPKIIKLK